MFNMTSRQPHNESKTTAAVRKTKKTKITTAQFTFTSVKTLCTSGIELKVMTPLRCKYCRDFILEYFFSLSPADYAHNVSMSDSEFGTNGSDRGKSLTLLNFVFSCINYGHLKIIYK